MKCYDQIAIYGQREDWDEIQRIFDRFTLEGKMVHLIFPGDHLSYDIRLADEYVDYWLTPDHGRVPDWIMDYSDLNRRKIDQAKMVYLVNPRMALDELGLSYLTYAKLTKTAIQGNVPINESLLQDVVESDLEKATILAREQLMKFMRFLRQQLRAVFDDIRSQRESCEFMEEEEDGGDHDNQEEGLRDLLYDILKHYCVSFGPMTMEKKSLIIDPWFDMDAFFSDLIDRIYSLGWLKGDEGIFELDAYQVDSFEKYGDKEVADFISRILIAGKAFRDRAHMDCFVNIEDKSEMLDDKRV